MPTTAGARQADAKRDAGAEVGHVNEVHLVGRLAAAPVRRELPSGDVLTSFRLVVARDRPRRGGTTRTPTIDALDCAAWRKDVQRMLDRLDPGDVVEVHGSLRRRFWRGAAGPVSRSEVEVLRLRRSSAAQD